MFFAILAAAAAVFIAKKEEARSRMPPFLVIPGPEEDVLRAEIGNAKIIFDGLIKEQYADERALGYHLSDLNVSPHSTAALLESLIIPAEVRNRGMGGFLLAQAEQWAIKEGATTLFLQAGNPETGGDLPTPIGFYASHGYTNLAQLGHIAVMGKRLDGKPLRGALTGPGTVPDVTKDLPPELPALLLQHFDRVARRAFPGYDDAPCVVVSEAIADESIRLGVPLSISYAGARVDNSHVYLVLRSRDPRWDLSILDFTVRQYIDAPRAAAWQRCVAGTYPRCPIEGLALVPPGHPFYAEMGYNPDPNVGTVEDPSGGSWHGNHPPSAAWRPPSDHALWRSYDPEVEIHYTKTKGEKEAIARAVSAVHRVPSWLLTDEGPEWKQEEAQQKWEEKTLGPEDLRKLRREVGLPILGFGASRIVFDLGRDKALKVAWPESGGCNLEEWDTWNSAPASIACFLVPVLDADAKNGDWLIMPIVGGMIDREKRKEIQREREQELYDACQAQNLYMSGLDDAFRHQNWGWHTGRLKLLDYAGAGCIGAG